MRRGIGVLLLLAGLLRAEDAAEDAFVEEHCLGCHAGRRAKAGLDLQREDLPADAWLRARLRVRRGEMPPADAPRPPREEVRAFLARLDARFGAPVPAPRSRLHRLTRAEYENSVRDLLGVDFDGAALPAATGPALPPALLEKYLAAAEEIAARAIVDEGAPPPVRRFEGPALRVAGSGRATDHAAYLYANGEISADVELPREGEYRVTAEAYGQQAGPEPVRIALRVGGRDLARPAVPAVAGAPGRYEARARLPGGATRVAAAFLNDYYRPDAPDPHQRDRNLVVVALEVEGPLDAPPLPAVQRALLPRPVPEVWGSALREVVSTLATRAWRRPVTEEEVGRLLRAVEEAEPEDASFHARVRRAVAALLSSPRFLFRVEDGSDYALAARLAAFLWSSLPDDELSGLAAEGRLREEAVLRAQVRRMLKDARASALARGFAVPWLQVGVLDGDAHADDSYPGVDAALRQAMVAETELFFDAVLREGRSVRELLDSDFTFLDARLAAHYGVPGVRGDVMRRVHLADDRRGGVLAQGSVLLATSNPDRTSPVKRGKWVLEVLLDQAPPPPPPSAGRLDETPEARASASLRERLERHRRDPACAGCHERMDALGFALENYGPAGRWREADGPFPIDSTGALPDGRTVRGPRGLKELLAGDPAFLRSLARHLCAYALDRPLVEADEDAVADLAGRLEREPALARLVEDIACLEAFRG